MLTCKRPGQYHRPVRSLSLSALQSDVALDQTSPLPGQALSLAGSNGFSKVPTRMAHLLWMVEHCICIYIYTHETLSSLQKFGLLRWLLVSRYLSLDLLCEAWPGQRLSKVKQVPGCEGSELWTVTTKLPQTLKLREHPDCRNEHAKRSAPLNDKHNISWWYQLWCVWPPQHWRFNGPVVALWAETSQ